MIVKRFDIKGIDSLYFKLELNLHILNFKLVEKTKDYGRHVRIEKEVNLYDEDNSIEIDEIMFDMFENFLKKKQCELKYSEIISSYGKNPKIEIPQFDSDELDESEDADEP